MSDARFKTAIEEMNRRREESGIDMNGKKYSKVSDRVEVFRQQFGGEFGINTEIDYRTGDTGEAAFSRRGGIVICKAMITHIATGSIAGSGHAMAFYQSDEVNTGSIVEAVETAAIGRALASFGLAGGEYASGNEMAALTAKQQAAVNMSTQETRVVKQGSKEEPRSQKEREFREAVDNAFPPSENSFSFFVPRGNTKEEIDAVFAEVDRIDNLQELTAYYHALQETMQWLKPEDLNELKSTFKTRNNQLKGF